MEVEEIKKMIRQNDLHRFYVSAEWRTLATAARVQQHNECQRCKARGYYKACEIVHHKRYVKKFPQLALDPDNLECLCKECHEEEHHKNEKPLTQERW
ncbi:MAG: HNH endonuclease [Candidatus Alectryocaccobium sp.]|jgi:5-methylcytosine-specific restriction protein A